MPQALDTTTCCRRTDVFTMRGLNSSVSMVAATPFSKSQNRAILIAGLSCACVSFVAAFIALRWFVLMKRSFRHHLVLFLIASDTFKALWYFVFAVVAISRGPVASRSGFCQASGFFLLLAVEAADFAILIIALHTMVSIFKPTSKAGEGGLYPNRNWIYLIWLGPPLLAASLAFVNDHGAYVTSGTYCYLPKRPFWYQLALSWIPRYLIITLIFLMYLSIYIYVHIKFRGFSVLGGNDSSQKSTSASKQSVGLVPPAIETVASTEPPLLPSTQEPPKSLQARPSAFRVHSYSSLLASSPKPPPVTADAPWDALSFITARPLQEQNQTHPGGVAAEDFAQESRSTESQETRAPHWGVSTSNGKDKTTEQDDRKASETPTVQTNYTGETATTHTTFNTTFSTMPEPENSGTTDHLREARQAIRRQLRFLFIYPIIYVLMWSFPFASHTLNYDDYYVKHPIFWLTVVSTCSLALQAGVDSVVFSWREKPWRRIDERSRWSLPHFRGQILGSMNRGSLEGSSHPASAQSTQMATVHQAKRSPSNWWEAEGRKRKDSVWMGTDLLTRMATAASNRDQRSNGDQNGGGSRIDRADEESSVKSQKVIDCAAWGRHCESI